MLYDIYRRDKFIMIIESGRPPDDIELKKWHRMHISATHYVLANQAKSVKQIDEEIRKDRMSTFPLKEGARGL